MIPEVVTLLILAIAVGMDAFSVSIGLSIYRLRLRTIFNIGLTIGLFHTLIPLIGILTGHFLSHTFGKVTDYIGGGLLVVLGSQMLFSSLKKEEHSLIVPVGWGLILFGLAVSIDSFSAGLSLGIFGSKAIVTICTFGIVATILTWSGLLIGRKVQGLLGLYGELFGGCILIILGIKLLFPF